MKMRSLLVFILASYAVNCDDNYYVIEMPDDPPTLWDSQRPFRVYWNVPTMQCTSKKIPFNNLDRFGILQNKGDSFRGDRIAILYDPGLFPALLKNDSSGEYKFRNGGVPQEGNLEKHEEAFRNILESSVPDPDFNGVGIIDFESWRPVFRQNFGVLVPYKDVSVEIERKLHWWWPKNWMQAEAKRRFEDAARTFMKTTLSIAKQMRPLALWGYYGFPYCFNMANKDMSEACSGAVQRENDGIYWLWSESTALFPSVYSSKELSAPQLAALARGRLREAARVRRRGAPVLPYFWFRYRDGGFMTKNDLDIALKTFYKSGADGFIIWGSSKDVNTAEKCTELLDYVNNIMGPAIAKYASSGSSQNDVSVEENSISSNNTSENGTQIESDPEYHWVPPENYTQNIKEHVKELIKNSRINTSNENQATVIPERNSLLDIVIHLIMNEKQNLTEIFENTSEYSTVRNNKRDTSDEYSTIGDNYSTTEQYTADQNSTEQFTSEEFTTELSTTEILSTNEPNFDSRTVEYTQYSTEDIKNMYSTTTEEGNLDISVASDDNIIFSILETITKAETSTFERTEGTSTTTDLTQTEKNEETTESILDVNITELLILNNDLSKEESFSEGSQELTTESITSNVTTEIRRGFDTSKSINDSDPSNNKINNAKNKKKGLKTKNLEVSTSSDTAIPHQVCDSSASEICPLVVLRTFIFVHGIMNCFNFFQILS
ncbi:hyaluronidase-5-like isoform X1 [Amyelois transitella]|uniref:hyaluronidase-5-like isoform X1 n=1 Tax=Amyelois transitella TaxID=680683 RepID=UPI00298FA2B4|nr:hyaluronidase-5-like isoform X1 [Amyelois transitella]